jgi:hypothetical protein
MNPISYLRDRIRGWLPQEPHQPGTRVKANLSRPTPLAPILFRASGVLLSAVGVFLMVVFLYRGLAYASGSSFLFNSQQLFLPIFIVGITFAVVGMTLNAHSTQSDPIKLRRPCLIAGLTLLTLSIFFNIYLVFEEERITVIQYDSLIAPYITYFMFAAFAGGLILFLGLPKWSALPSLLKKSYFAIAVGAAMSLGSALISLLHLFPSSFTSSSLAVQLSNPVVLFSWVLYPIGIVCLALGWAGVFSVSIKKRPILLPSLFTLLVAIALFLSLIPI